MSALEQYAEVYGRMCGVLELEEQSWLSTEDALKRLRTIIVEFEQRNAQSRCEQVGGQS